MAVRIRLKKMGRKHRPFFRVCAMDGRAPRDGRVIEELGIYDPMVRETDARAILKGERIDYWMGVGAKPTPKVGVLIKKYGTDGTHLEQQQVALGRMSTRRADSIVAAAKAAEEAAKAMPVVEEEPEETPAAEGEATESAEASADASAEATATDETAAKADSSDSTEGGDDSGEKSE